MRATPADHHLPGTSDSNSNHAQRRFNKQSLSGMSMDIGAKFVQAIQFFGKLNDAICD